jgi:hypothetical protein
MWSPPATKSGPRSPLARFHLRLVICFLDFHRDGDVAVDDVLFVF